MNHFGHKGKKAQYLELVGAQNSFGKRIENHSDIYPLLRHNLAFKGWQRWESSKLAQFSREIL
jgi:hypothetical protein